MDWILNTNFDNPRGNFVVLDLIPATSYTLKVTAHYIAWISLSNIKYLMKNYICTVCSLQSCHAFCKITFPVCKCIKTKQFLF